LGLPTGKRRFHQAASFSHKIETSRDSALLASRIGFPTGTRAGIGRHVKNEESYKLRLLLGHRRTVKRNVLDIENEIAEQRKIRRKTLRRSSSKCRLRLRD
jgi:transposase